MDPKEKLIDLLGPRFGRVFNNATFTETGVVFPGKFQADWAASNCAMELRLAFGKDPEITVFTAADAIKQAAENKKRMSGEVVPIQRARSRKIGFAAREMVLMNLPHSDPKAPYWIRRNGTKAFLVQGGYRIDPKDKTGKTAKYVGIPYGPKARLILFYLMTEAKVTKKRRIYLGDSFNAFLEAIGTKGNRGGRDSGRDAVKKQLDRILTASFYTTESASFEDADYLAKSPTYRFVGEASLWFSKDLPDQMTLWESYIDLSPEFFESITKSAIPLDWDVLLELKNSSLEIDLYALLTYEASRARRSGQDRFIPWAALQNQFGSGYGTTKNFSSKCRAALAKIRELYPALKLGDRQGGLDILRDSLPSVEGQPLPLMWPDEE